MKPFNVHNLLQWVEENKDELKPPVCNKEVYPGGDFIVMVIGGPNLRKDYHYNEGPEFFYQIKGDITLKVIEEGEFKDVVIKEGEMYLLNPKVPHSPQRPEGTVGLVIEEKRKDYQTDGFQWYCDSCGHKLHDEYFKLVNIEKQLPETFAKFNGNVELHKCSNCGDVLKVPNKATTAK
ncbi:3-hydroxyanthranilate 3,4-dioxygenase [uncultured Microscilla sp.]|uniref:3-hydroxyanthranilate 3,4-dioxygenase n=1 Tax=uncultured Microscilla sp. TaxID=432653 RepID=UPI00261EA5BC|nr:3-hydroxyanthranilate 3,4-dioxygenase [uncultured Microscilla sp.]